MVVDRSMAPAFLPGDRLYVDPRPGRTPRLGEPVVVRDPERAGRLLLKRVGRAPDVPPVPDRPSRTPALWLLGDNRPDSRDSRRFGPVPADAVVGVVWFRYAPSGRRGRVGGEPLSDVADAHIDAPDGP